MHKIDIEWAEIIFRKKMKKFQLPGAPPGKRRYPRTQFFLTRSTLVMAIFFANYCYKVFCVFFELFTIF